MHDCREGNTALHLACQSNQLKVIEVLLQWGARANMTNASGFAPVSTEFPASLTLVCTQAQELCASKSDRLPVHIAQLYLWLFVHEPADAKIAVMPCAAASTHACSASTKQCVLFLRDTRFLKGYNEKERIHSSRASSCTFDSPAADC